MKNLIFTFFTFLNSSPVEKKKKTMIPQNKTRSFFSLPYSTTVPVLVAVGFNVKCVSAEYKTKFTWTSADIPSREFLCRMP
jgi:hypothetical protein